jgi:hypothetical protein
MVVSKAFAFAGLACDVRDLGFGCDQGVFDEPAQQTVNRCVERAWIVRTTPARTAYRSSTEFDTNPGLGCHIVHRDWLIPLAETAECILDKHEVALRNRYGLPSM